AVCSFTFSLSPSLRYLHSFPTRRSSDLCPAEELANRRVPISVLGTALRQVPAAFAPEIRPPTTLGAHNSADTDPSRYFPRCHGLRGRAGSEGGIGMKQRWTVEELDEQWSLNERERQLVGNKTGPTRLGFTALLKYCQHEGRFPQGEADIPDAVIAHLARLVEVPAEALRKYEWSGRTIEYHRAQIRSFLGFR